MIFGYTQLCQESTDIGVVARLPQLINPTGTDAEGLGGKENILQSAGPTVSTRFRSTYFNVGRIYPAVGGA